VKILVTGGIGNVGTGVIARLFGHGHEVTVIGRRPGMTVPGARYRGCDITDIDALVEATKGHEAIVHLAAFGNPSLGTPDVIFRVNCQGTMNVYEAAARCGIRRVVTASSINALGYGFGVKEWSYRYFPVDEDHPTFATDAYSFSKNIVEEIGRFWWRRDGISGTCLRLPAVAVPPGSSEENIRNWTGCLRAEFSRLQAMPAAERARTLDDWMARLARARELRAYENPINPGFTSDIPLMTARQDLWTAVDDRDAAQGIEKSLTVPYEGCHVLFLNDSHNWAGIPSADLAAMFYPKVKTWKRQLAGTESLISIERARKLLGYEPEYSASRFYG
jgi:nucleoside-diphosphate-sugar epimerase